MDPITIILGIFALIGSIGFAARDRQDQKKANKEVMDFNAEEAEKSRDWQEEQYKKYESVAAQMQQRQQAGLNPYEGVTSMSVGSGSTASSSANQISPLSKTDFSLLSQIPGMATQVKQTKLQNKLLAEQTEGVKLDNEAKTLENLKLAIEANDYASYYALIKEGLVKGNQLTDVQIKKAFEEARLAAVNANQAEEAAAAGVNPIIDESNYKQAQTALANATANLTDANRKSVEFALKLSEKFDEQFLQLSLSERMQQVKEYLEQSEIRASLAQFAKTLQENATQISNRETALNEVQTRIVRDMLLAVESNLNADNLLDNIQSVIAFSYVTNPSATISAITNLIPDLSIKNNSSKTTHTHYDTGTRFTTINN